MAMTKNIFKKITMRIIFISCVSVAAILYACDDKNIIPDDDCLAMTRVVVNNTNVSISNPYLLENWEKVDRIILNTLGAKEVTVPWGSGSSSSLPETFRKDIKKEDGWKMIFHTFKKVGLDEKQNYICFYNQFTGYLKFFYFYEGDKGNQGTQWFIMTSEGQKVKLLEEPTYLAKINTESATNDILLFSNLVGNPISGIEPGWNGFEFQVPYYSTDLTDMDFVIGAYNKQITDYNFLGKTELSTVGTITSSKKNDFGLSKGIANISGSDAKKLIDKLGENIFGDKVVLGKKVIDLITSIPTSGYISAIKSGLNLIFGKTTTTTSEVKLTTTGSINISGTSSTEVTAGIPSLSFNLYEILNPSKENKHYLGVWSLKEKPAVYYNRISQITGVSTIGMDANGKKIIKGNTDFPTIQRCVLNTEINPDILPYISKSSFSAKYILCKTLQGESYKYSSHDFHEAYNMTLLYSDENQLFYEGDLVGQRSIEANVVHNANTSQTYFYDWGNVRDGKILAVVSFNVTFLYEGKETEITQSRVYDVSYGVDSTVSPEQRHNPPYSIVVNYGYPDMRLNYGWE